MIDGGGGPGERGGGGATGPAPRLVVRDLACGVAGGLAGELAAAGAVLGVAAALTDGPPPVAATLAWAAGAGLAVGLAFGAALALARRARRPGAATPTAGLAPLASRAPWNPAGALFVLTLGAALSSVLGDLAALALEEPTPMHAAVELAERLPGRRWWPEAGVLGSGALCALGPVLLAVARGGGPAAAALAGLVGAYAWLALAALAAPRWPDSAPLAAVAAAVLVRPLAFAPALAGAERATDALRRALGLAPAPPVGALGGARPGARPRGPAARHRARWLDDQADAAAARGDGPAASAAADEALALWPTPERALAAARAAARAGLAPDALAARLLAGGVGDLPELAHDPDLAGLAGHPALAGAEGPPGAGRRRPAVASGQGLALALPLALLCVGLPLRLFPDEPASWTRERVVARLSGDAGRWRRLAHALERPVGPVPGEVGLLRVATPWGWHHDPGLAAARAGEALERAAALGDGESMLELARARAGERARADEAAGWLRRAAEAGHPPAMTAWALAQGNGWGGAPIDPSAAEAWLARAAAADEPTALFELALRLPPGREAEAVGLLRRAADRGELRASEALASLGLDGEPGAPARAAGRP